MRAFFAQALWLLMAFAAVAVGAGAALAGTAGAIGALAGAGIAVLDLGFLGGVAGVLGRRGGALGRGSLGGLLVMKFPLLAGVLYLLIVPLALHPVGLALGFGSLPMALVTGTLTGRLPMDLRVRNERSLG